MIFFQMEKMVKLPKYGSPLEQDVPGRQKGHRGLRLL